MVEMHVYRPSRCNTTDSNLDAFADDSDGKTLSVNEVSIETPTHDELVDVLFEV